MHYVFVYWTDTREALAKCLDSTPCVTKEPLGPVRHLSSILVIAYHCSGLGGIRDEISRRGVVTRHSTLSDPTHKLNCWTVMAQAQVNVRVNFGYLLAFRSQNCRITSHGRPWSPDYSAVNIAHLPSRTSSGLFRRSSTDYCAVRIT